MAEKGGCMCGAIRYEVTGVPEHIALCWCDRCRASAGATPVGWALFANEEVAIDGDPSSYESSPGVFRQFCGTCGTGLFYRAEAIFAGKVDIQIATLTNPDAFPPQAHIQVADAPCWIDRHDTLPRFMRFPGQDG